MRGQLPPGPSYDRRQGGRFGQGVGQVVPGAVSAAVVCPMMACADPMVASMALTVIPTVCPVLSVIGVCSLSTTVPSAREQQAA